MFGRQLSSIVLGTVTVLMIAVAGRGALRAAPAVAAAANAPSAVLITGGISELIWPNGWWGLRAEPPCTLLFVSASPPPPLLTLTTAGIGRSLLAETPGGRCPAADAPGWREELPLAAHGGYRRRPVALRLDPQATPPTDGLLEGRVIALAGDSQAGAATLKVRREATPLWLQSFQWFLGIGVPALLAFLATKGAQRVDARSAFLVYRVLEAGKIRGTIGHIQSDLKDPEVTERGRVVYETMRDEGMLAKLTPRSQRRLMKLCYKNDMVKFVRLMRRLFPREAETLAVASAGAR